MKKLLLMLAAAAMTVASQAQTAQTFTLTSPDGSVVSLIEVGHQTTYTLSRNGQDVILASPVSMTLTDGTVWGQDVNVKKALQQKVNTTVPSPFYRAKEMNDAYNALTLYCKGDYQIEFRAYNDGVAYRFATTKKKAFEVKNEGVSYRFASDDKVVVPYVRDADDSGNYEPQFYNSFENLNTKCQLTEMKNRLAFLPIVVKQGQTTVCLTESHLENYPGLYLVNDGGTTALHGVFARVPKRMEQGGHNRLQMEVKEREDFIARVDKPRQFPWRIAIVGSDADVAASNLTYLLGAPCRIDDTSWIRPGKVAWDWWNDWNLAGVPFKSGINNDTYKYYIDFASKHGIEYVILDEGWAVNLQADLMQVVPEIDLEMLIAYAKERNVGLILWAGYYAFARDMENVCRHYSEMGIKGFKVDFMDRDDQLMTDFNYRAAAMAAKYHLLLDLHGSHKPAGINRTYPNVLNCEGVHGLENMKWESAATDQLEYDTEIPFTRQVGGPMDYTQGAMHNASEGNYYPSNSEPMSQGTRCHQLGLYIVFESPLNMLCDSPTNYEKEPESTDFIASIPTVWDETRIIDGKIGEYIITARRSGQTWYIGGITNKQPRTVSIDLGSLPISAATATAFVDGPNAYRKGCDYLRQTIQIPSNKQLTIEMQPGGGFAMKIGE